MRPSKWPATASPTKTGTKSTAPANATAPASIRATQSTAASPTRAPARLARTVSTAWSNGRVAQAGRRDAGDDQASDSDAGTRRTLSPRPESAPEPDGDSDAMVNESAPTRPKATTRTAATRGSRAATRSMAGSSAYASRAESRKMKPMPPEPTRAASTEATIAPATRQANAMPPAGSSSGPSPARSDFVGWFIRGRWGRFLGSAAGPEASGQHASTAFWARDRAAAERSIRYGMRSARERATVTETMVTSSRSKPSR